MAAATNYMEMQVLGHILGTGTFTKPSGVWLGLFIASPDDTGGGTEVTISAATGYVRKSLVQIDATWTGLPTAGAGVITNADDITFATCNTLAWGTVVAVGVFDAVTAGNLLMYGAVSSPSGKYVGPGDTFKFLATDLDITMD